MKQNIEELKRIRDWFLEEFTRSGGRGVAFADAIDKLSSAIEDLESL